MIGEDQWEIEKTSEKGFRFIDKKPTEKKQDVLMKQTTKSILELFAGFPLSLIWSYSPLVPLCLQM